MIYPYSCPKCGTSFDVIKSADMHRRKEKCKCGTIADRVYTLPNLNIDRSVPEYNPAFGKVIKNRMHLKQEAKDRDMVEIGNERPDKIHKRMNNQKEHRRQQRWDNVMKEI